MKNTCLSNLRKSFEKFGIDAYLVPSSDSHNVNKKKTNFLLFHKQIKTWNKKKKSEYLREIDQRRSYISKFTGSAGKK